MRCLLAADIDFRSHHAAGAVVVRPDARVCGPCSACCTAIAVHELKKHAWQACEHLGESGCGVYADRPASCRNFECQWLKGMLEPEETVDTGLRPDACGVIFDYQPDTAYGDLFTAWEVEPGAAAHGRAKDVIDGLAGRFPVMVVTADPAGTLRLLPAPPPQPDDSDSPVP